MKGATIDHWYLIISIFVISASSIGFIMLLKEMDQKTILLKNTRIQQDKLKLEALNITKDKLFSIIAHDLRSPFNGILGFSELLIKNTQDFEVGESEKYLGIINSSAKSTLTLLDNLLHWAKTQTG
ncbi:histidine kinase dimerization/phospho-acceptor domain-containing protein [Lutibacter sp.]|uniref:sensor histidine kinase n=1 Tax=Lutibacter sp. TaxID=1925666 RepID=UPI0025C3D0CE|nr:histidine kinase dimerization/phospho-acceptor domain-containing protein [Lutibacter sp.]